MKKLLFFSAFGLLIYSCAPVVKCKPYENAVNIPNNFKADGYVSYGIIDYPISLVKDKENYTFKSFLGNLDFKSGNICAYGSCINIPMDISKLIYGDVVDKTDTKSCESGYTVYEASNSIYTKKVYVKDGKLYKMDILNKSGEKELSIYFKNRSKEGYYKNLEIKKGNFDIDVKIDNLESV